MSKSYSQSGQDQFIKYAFNNKKNGYFLEIGGGDGMWISNTLLLEEDLNWTGILVEPSRAYEKLIQNRPNCICIKKCVSNQFKQLTLVEIHDKGQAAINPEKALDNILLTKALDEQVSAKEEFDSHWGVAKDAYQVDAEPLEFILDQVNAPKYIDYFSLDVEGHEESVLMDFPFSKYLFGCIGVENPSERLQKKLSEEGFKKVRQLGADAMYLNTLKFNILT